MSLTFLLSAASTLQQAIIVVFHFVTGTYFQEVPDPSLKNRTMKNILILGGSYGGVGTAHRILKQAAKTGPIKVTIVSPNSDLYWSVAAVRGLIPGQLTDDQLFQPIAPGFKKYPNGQFEFILASAKSLDTVAKKVEISSFAGTRTLDYDFLILATGSTFKENTPLKMIGSTEATKDALHELQMKVQKAKTIVVAGAGATGVETAGELAYEYGRSKEIILIASGPTVLEGRPASVSKTALKYLQDLAIDVKLQIKVKNSTQLPNGRQELTFSSDEKLIADLYIPTYGMVPNSSYVGDEFLDINGLVKVDEYLKVKGVQNVWAIGDVSDTEPPQILYCDKQSVHVAKNLVLILSNKTPLHYKAATSGMMGLQIGKKTGTGHFGNMKIPSFVVATLRKTLFVEKLPKMVDGSAF